MDGREEAFSCFEIVYIKGIKKIAGVATIAPET